MRRKLPRHLNTDEIEIEFLQTDAVIVKNKFRKAAKEFIRWKRIVFRGKQNPVEN